MVKSQCFTKLISPELFGGNPNINYISTLPLGWNPPVFFQVIRSFLKDPKALHVQLEVTSLTFLNRASQLHFERQTDLRFRWFLAGRLGKHWQLRQRWGTGPYCYSNAAPVEFYRSVFFCGGLGSWILVQQCSNCFHLWQVLKWPFEWAYPYMMFQHHLLRKISYCLSMPSKKEHKQNTR